MTDWNPPNTEYPPPKPGEPPLHAAARKGDHDAIRALVGGGKDVNETFDIELDPGADNRPATPLMVASGSGDGASAETVRLLLELGADATRILDAESAATFACAGLGWNYRPGGDADRLRLLLDRGAPLPQNPARANRVLCDTAKLGDAARLGVLLENGMAANGHWDAEVARDETRRMMEMLAEHRESPAAQNSNASDDLHKSMDDAVAQVERDMYEQQCSAPWSHEIPLHCAAQSGDALCVQTLLRAGADPTKRDNSKRTALYDATSVEAVRAMLDAGLPIEDEDTHEWSPLVSALGDGEDGMETIRALIECGADVNATHDNGYTVFMSALGSNRHQPMLRLLVEAGADPHAVSELGYNAFHAAIDVDFEAREEASVRSTLTYLHVLGVDIEHRNNRGQTPLARAIDHGIGTEVRVLCDLGADPNAVCPMHKCREGVCESIDTPMLHAAADGTGVDRDEKVSALLDAGADPLVEDSEGFTPLVRVVAALCEDADDYSAAFQAFYEGLRSLKFSGGAVPHERAEYVSQATPDLRAYAERFAADIPVPTGCEFEQQWRDERITCIVLLGTHEGWARWQRIHRERTESD